MAKRSRSEKASRPAGDPGTVPGLAAGGLVLALWALTSLGGTGSAASENPAGGPFQTPPTVPEGPAEIGQGATAPPPGTETLQPLEHQSVQAWEAEEDWQLAVEKGEEGLEKVRKARRRHQRSPGDPFRYKRDMLDARKSLETSLDALRRLEEAYQGDEAALAAIQQQTERYMSVMHGVLKETRGG